MRRKTHTKLTCWTRRVLLFMAWPIFSCVALDFQNPENGSNATITTHLQTAAVTRTMGMTHYLKAQGLSATFKSDVYVLSLEGGVRGVFKPAKNIDEAEAEVVAFRIAQHLKFPYVPPTVIRTLTLEADKPPATGALQLLVENVEKIENTQHFLHALKSVSFENIEHAKVFAALTGQWDTQWSNFLIKHKAAKTYLTSIDHANIFQRQRGAYGELPFVQLGPPLDCVLKENGPFADAVTIQKPTLETLTHTFGHTVVEQYKHVMTMLAKRAPLCARLLIWHKRVWRQYYDPLDTPLNRDALYDEHLDLMPAYVHTLSPNTYASLKRLDKAALESCLAHASPVYIKDLLMRRDAILREHSQEIRPSS